MPTFLPQAQIEAPRNALVNFAPLTEALGESRRNAFAREELDLRQRQESRQQADRDWQLKKRQIDEFGNLAQAVEAERDPTRRAALWNTVLRRHGTTGLAPEELDPATGPRLMMAAAGKVRNVLDEQARQAEINLHNAQADYYRRRGTAVPIGGALDDERLDPSQFGMTEDGRIVPVAASSDRRSAVLPDQYTAPGSVAVGPLSPEQQRLQQHYELQDRYRKIYGKPKPGYIWAEGPDGPYQKVVAEAANTVGEKAAQRTAAYHLDKVNRAEKILTAAWLPQRYIAGKADYGTIGQAFADYRQSVLGLVYALSGKQTAVKEMEAFLQAYMPAPTDSAWRIQEKTARIKDFMGQLTGVDVGKLPPASDGKPSPTPGGWHIRRLD